VGFAYATGSKCPPHPSGFRKPRTVRAATDRPIARRAAADRPREQRATGGEAPRLLLPSESGGLDLRSRCSSRPLRKYARRTSGSCSSLSEPSVNLTSVNPCRARIPPVRRGCAGRPTAEARPDGDSSRLRARLIRCRPVESRVAGTRPCRSSAPGKRPAGAHAAPRARPHSPITCSAKYRRSSESLCSLGSQGIAPRRAAPNVAATASASPRVAMSTSITGMIAPASTATSPTTAGQSHRRSAPTPSAASREWRHSRPYPHPAIRVLPRKPLRRVSARLVEVEEVESPRYSRTKRPREVSGVWRATSGRYSSRNTRATSSCREATPSFS
jgi:hypothetical protein